MSAFFPPTSLHLSRENRNTRKCIHFEFLSLLWFARQLDVVSQLYSTRLQVASKPTGGAKSRTSGQETFTESLKLVSAILFFSLWTRVVAIKEANVPYEYRIWNHGRKPPLNEYKSTLPPLGMSDSLERTSRGEIIAFPIQLSLMWRRSADCDRTAATCRHVRR